MQRADEVALLPALAAAGGLFRAIPAAACPLHPVIQAHEAALQAEFDAAAAQTRAALAGEPTDFMQQFGMQHLALDQMVVCPSAAFFQRHRPVSRHDLPPHELARVRRVHPRGQAEPARLQP